MRILVHDYAGHPFQVQLSRFLAGRGHEVLHAYFASFQTPHGALEKKVGDPNTFDVHGVQLDEPFEKYAFVKRRGQEKKYGALIAREVDAYHPDIVISGNTPLDAQVILLDKCKRLKIGFIFWVQDLYGVAVYKLLKDKIPIIGKAVGQYYMRLERRLLSASDEIVLITEDFIPVMENWGVDRHRLHVVHNWAPLEEMPLMPKVNTWSVDKGLADKFVIMYSGTLGMKHNPELLLQLALRFKDDANMRVVVVSEGLGANWLKERREALGLGNLVILDFQPFEQLPAMLASADILVAVLEPDAGIFSVPSKVLSYLCAQRPLVLAVPPENLAARIVSGNGAGIVVGPNDGQAFVGAVEKLASDAGLRAELGDNALAYALSHFNVEMIGETFEMIMAKCLGHN